MIVIYFVGEKTMSLKSHWFGIDSPDAVALAAIILVSDSREGERSFLDDDTNCFWGGDQGFWRRIDCFVIQEMGDFWRQFLRRKKGYFKRMGAEYKRLSRRGRRRRPRKFFSSSSNPLHNHDEVFLGGG